MSLPLLPLIDGALFIDNSGWLENIGTCLRKLEYSQLFKRISAGDKPALNFGSAIHLGLEYRYVRYKNQPVDDFYYEDVGTMLTQFFADHPCPEGDFRDLNWAMTVLRRYNEKYSVEEFNLLKYDVPVKCPYCDQGGIESQGGNKDAANSPLRSIAGLSNSEGISAIQCLWCQDTKVRDLMVEIPFALPLYTHYGVDEGFRDLDGVWNDGESIPVFYSGRIDLPNVRQGSLDIIDHKSSSMLGSTFFDRMKMSAQQKGYCWSFEQLTKQKVKSYTVNGIRTKEPPQYVTDNKALKGRSSTPASWWGESLQRETYYIKPGELDEWRENTIDMMEEFFWHYARGYMPMRTANCTQFGRCQYFDVCSLDRNDRGLMLSSGLFSNNVWSPLNSNNQKTKP